MQYHYVSDKELYHYGRSKKDGAKVGSGRYPLGSGKKSQRQKDVEALKSHFYNKEKGLKGLTSDEIRNIYDRNLNHKKLRIAAKKQERFNNLIDEYENELNNFRDTHKKEIYDEIKKQYDGDDQEARSMYNEVFWDVSENLAIKDKSFSKVYRKYENARLDAVNIEKKIVRNFLKEEYDTLVPHEYDSKNHLFNKQTLGSKACSWVFANARDYK